MQVGQADRLVRQPTDRATSGQLQANEAFISAMAIMLLHSTIFRHCVSCVCDPCSTTSNKPINALTTSHHRCISALTSNHTASSLVEASQGILPPDAAAQWGGGSCLLPLLEQLTLALVAAGGVGVCDEEPWLHDCMEMMLEVRCACRMDLFDAMNVEFLTVLLHLSCNQT